MFIEKSHAKFGSILVPFLLAAGLAAQTTSSVQIYTVPPGLNFYVDGQKFVSAVTLLWPQGSKHSIRTDGLQGGNQGSMAYTNPSMSTNLVAQVQDWSAITADPALTWIQIAFSTSYAVNLNYFACPAGINPASCGSPGTVYLNGTAFTQNGQQFAGAGSTLTVQAFPNPGFVFAGWLPPIGVQSTSQAFALTLPVNGPITLFPIFQRARSVSMSIATSPVGLQVLLDRTPYLSPTTLEWGVNTTHQIGGISPQYDQQGKLWIFNSWSDGGAYSHAYTVPSGYSTINLTANFVAGTMVTFLTNPPGLPLMVDGRNNYSNYTFAWVPGSTHSVSAPMTNTDASGNAYQFDGWSNLGPATQQITASTDLAANRYTANYKLAGSITIQSSPAGVPIQVDGQACTTPCNVIRAIGATVQISAPANSSPSDGVRLDFLGWADNAAPSRTLTATAQAQTLTASYKLRYQLRASSDPGNGVIWQTQPASPDLFFDAQSPVYVSVSTQPGFQFLNWSGDVSGSMPSVSLVMTAPRNVIAQLNPIPYIVPGGIQNSAAQTPHNTVAPGSAVAIYGVNLAADLAAAPPGKLPHTLEHVTVRVGGQVVPLFFVSPGQINVQLPSNLVDGKHTLTVHLDGKPEASETFNVARNAPGLFSTGDGNAAIAVATHQDGTAISAHSPARHGEVVTLYGTGLGPYHPEPADGVAVPSNAKYPLADPVMLMTGKQKTGAVWAGAAPAKIAVAAVQIKIDETFPHGANAAVKVHVNNAESNTVVLPVQ
jgi:uncharacterized protein (TIGR03437 family)